ncbi:NifU family protein [Nocardiopsis rhodophaea]|uniref:NifU family protein n=1 Tax=Nocardiopsis rhodophaea TaxID=280238 RepID=UPI0031D6C0C4
MTTESALDSTSERVEQLLDELAGSHPEAHERAEEVIRLVVQLYGTALGRIVERVGELTTASSGEDGAPPSPLEPLLDDALIAGLLVLHDLHPHDTATRVRQALERVRPYLGSHAGDVEIVDVDREQGVAVLRLQGNCHGCPSSAETVRNSIERVIAEAAPEIGEVRVEGVAESPPDPAEPGFVPLDSLRHRPPEHSMTCTVPADLAGPAVAGDREGAG